MSDGSEIKAGLREYWRHDDDCHVTAKGDDAPCSCGARVTLLAIEAAITSARAQGAAEERERLAKCADAYSTTDLYDINDGGCQFLSRPEWCETAHWLRSNTGEG